MSNIGHKKLTVTSLIMLEIGVIFIFALVFLIEERNQFDALPENAKYSVSVDTIMALKEKMKEVEKELGIPLKFDDPVRRFEELLDHLLAAYKELRERGRLPPDHWTKLVEYVGEMDALQNLLKQRTAALEDLRQDISRLQAEIARLNQQITDSNARRIDTQKALNQTRDQLDKLQEKTGTGVGRISCLVGEGGRPIPLYQIFYVEGGVYVRRYPNAPDDAVTVRNWLRAHNTPLPSLEPMEAFASRADFLRRFEPLDLWAARESGFRCVFYAQSVTVYEIGFGEKFNQWAGQSFYSARAVTNPERGRQMLLEAFNDQ